MHAATHAATSHWRRSANSSRSSSGSTTSGQTVEMHPAFTLIGLAVTVLIGAVIFMGINGPYEDRTGYYVTIGIASVVLVLAVAYLIYMCAKQQRQKEDKPLTSQSEPASASDKNESSSTMPMLPIPLP